MIFSKKIVQRVSSFDCIKTQHGAASISSSTFKNSDARASHESGRGHDCPELPYNNFGKK